MRKIKEVIVVEGRYDQNTLAQVVDATVVTLGGFAVFNDREKVAFLRRLAAERGLIVLTDSDGAGFVIRNYLKGALPKEQGEAGLHPGHPRQGEAEAGPRQGGQAGSRGDEAGGNFGGSPPGGRHLSGRGNGGAGGGKRRPSPRRI